MAADRGDDPLALPTQQQLVSVATTCCRSPEGYSRIASPSSARAMTSFWISEVPS